MVKMIVGSKGTGKTKALIDLVNDAAKNSKGNVVCIERGDALKFDLASKIRLIDIKEYHIKGDDAYYGFIAGLLAGNYDITEIYADATFKILCGKDSKDVDVLAKFIKGVAELTKDNHTTVTFTISCDKNDIPEDIRQYIAQ